MIANDGQATGFETGNIKHRKTRSDWGNVVWWLAQSTDD